MQLPSTFARRLHLARLNAGLEQRELGQMVGLTRDTIERLERGQTTQISIRALRKVARALNVTADWLIAMDVLDDETAEDLIATPHV